MNDKLYYERMQNALEEKLWFKYHLNLNDYDLIIDFGCADGTLLKAISKSTSALCLGYDKKLYKVENTEKINFTTSWSMVLGCLKSYRKTLVIFSSVLHEMNHSEINSKFEDLLMYGINTIVIRDMHFESGSDFMTIFDKKIFKENPYYEKIFKKKLWWNESSGRELTWQKLWTEFLLKYPYVENFERESKEEYFSTPFIHIEEICNRAGLKTKFCLNYTNKFIQERVKKDLSITLEHKTHRLLILRKED